VQAITNTAIDIDDSVFDELARDLLRGVGITLLFIISSAAWA
jgi:hypothetical protein